MRVRLIVISDSKNRLAVDPCRDSFAHFLRFIIGITLAGPVWFPARAPASDGMKVYQTPCYILHTDLDEDSEREAAIRMTKMAEEYRRRTSAFASPIQGKLPFYLYRFPEDYYKDGGLQGSIGIFIPDSTGGKLMAVAGDHPSMVTWHTVQHEGFHQFAHAAIGHQLPTWLDEGLAEYFAEGIFTGDGFVMGIVPSWRLKRLQTSIASGRLKPVREIMEMSPDTWREQLNVDNYDQVWSMVHFLVHGDGGKYQKAFATGIGKIARGETFEKAWLATWGPVDDFEMRWKRYWMSQQSDPTAELYTRATLCVLTSFLARAECEKQSFADFDQFLSTALAGKLRMSDADWLPPSLLMHGLQWAQKEKNWELTGNTLSVAAPDGSRLRGTFTINNGKVSEINVDMEK